MAKRIPEYLRVKRLVFGLIEQRMKDTGAKSVTKNEIVRMYVAVDCNGHAYDPKVHGRILDWAFYKSNYIPGNGSGCLCKPVPGDERYLERDCVGCYRIVNE